MTKETMTSPSLASSFSSPISYQRWKGFRRELQGVDAFKSVQDFERAQLGELYFSLSELDRKTLGRLLSRGQKQEIENFIRTHGANPIFDPLHDLDHKVGVAKADVVSLKNAPSHEAQAAILNGDIVHFLFQAGEASRFEQGPFFKLSPIRVARTLKENESLQSLLVEIDKLAQSLPSPVANFIRDGELGPKQPVLIRAALRKAVQAEVTSGKVQLSAAASLYEEAIRRQKILFFVSQQAEVNLTHEKALTKTFSFYGFNPENIATIEQDLIHGMSVNEEGIPALINQDWALDASGHLYALLQASRENQFISYTKNGMASRHNQGDAFSFLSKKGAKVINIIRINDMDRHSSEIINAKALSYALTLFSKGYVNAIECVSNPSGQKGGTGTTFDNPEIHCLTETHENSFPSLSRAFESAMNVYLHENEGRHPAYNAMRQWADLEATKAVVQKWGGRIVFVPRQKTVDGIVQNYLGVDMPMGDLSLFTKDYSSRMFQFSDGEGRELLIHDMKVIDNLIVAIRTIQRQLKDPHVIAAVKELFLKETVPFSLNYQEPFLYGAPTPEFEI